jgi:transmembrane 9 superfamily member 2/4
MARSPLSRAAAAVCGCLLLSAVSAYLPGVGPRKYVQDQVVDLYVNELTSFKKAVPFDYYSLPFCPLANHKPKGETLGEQLEGDVIEDSGYVLNVKQPKMCQLLCERKLSEKDIKRFNTAISDEYLVHMTVDGLPNAMRQDAPGTTEDNETAEPYYSRGYPIGTASKDGGKHYLHNHLRLTVAINAKEQDNWHIVGFIVEPFSLDHSAAQEECTNGITKEFADAHRLALDKPTTVKFTYDVVWEETGEHNGFCSYKSLQCHPETPAYTNALYVR